MKVAYFPNKLPKGRKTLILGAFNSFHNGHKKLIDEAKKLKHPIVLMIINGISSLPNKEEEYVALEIRLQQFANYGIDYVTIVNFNEVSLSRGKDFLKKIIDQTNATTFVAGKDFAMGKDRDLKINDIENSIIVETEKIGKRKISSSVLRELVEVGDVKLIRSLSPYYYQMSAHVDSEYNLSKINQAMPHPGIYSAWIYFKSIKYPATIHINMEKKTKILIPDFQAKNASFDVVISFVEMVRKIYKKSNDFILDEDKLKSNDSLLDSDIYL